MSCVYIDTPHWKWRAAYTICHLVTQSSFCTTQIWLRHYIIVAEKTPGVFQICQISKWDFFNNHSKQSNIKCLFSILCVCTCVCRSQTWPHVPTNAQYQRVLLTINTGSKTVWDSFSPIPYPILHVYMLKKSWILVLCCYYFTYKLETIYYIFSEPFGDNKWHFLFCINEHNTIILTNLTE